MQFYLSYFTPVVREYIKYILLLQINHLLVHGIRKFCLQCLCD